MPEKKKKSSGVGRKRNFAFCVYPESAPADWKQKLGDLHVPAFVSPLHNSDVNPDGTPKKAHYHVMLMFDGVKSDEQVEQVKKAVGGVGSEHIASPRGYARYLCHLDNPEKAQYKQEDVLCFCGADYREAVTLPTDVDAVVDEMTVYIDKYFVYSFRAFAAYCRDSKPDWSYALKHGGSFYVKEYIKSLAWESVSPEAKELEKLKQQKFVDGVMTE